ncbi:YitT family protein [Paludifilum halophilum]|uniref:YitT family protein n=1 Tax=Paludifilum halophilum TaxID=1642702 RepID=A0A235B989_9BACL|nr:YitT family protein [Paludifilum halophilum]OYD08836.1 hypothetical protein CHM34_03345 [Paludifilum halophilum]
MIRYLTVGCGGLLISLGVNLFLTPHRLLDGGILGLALILRYLWGVKMSLSIVLLSFPLFLIVWSYDRKLLFNSCYGMLVSSLLIDGLSPLRGFVQTPMLSSALLGGLLVGSGVGIMLRQRTSTGGTDLIAQYIAEKLNWNTGVLIFLIDALIIALGSLILEPVRLFHTFLVIIAVGFTTSLWIQGVESRAPS